VIVKKNMIPINPFDFDVGDVMPNPYDDDAKPTHRIYRFLDDGTIIEAKTHNNYTWRCSVVGPDGKHLKSKIVYSEASAREFVEEDHT
jgi:hypothetical protein